MKLKFTGLSFIRRQIGTVEWSQENGHIAEVPVAMAADLLTVTSDEFLIQEANQEEMQELANQLGVDVQALKKYQAMGLLVAAPRAQVVIENKKQKGKRAKKEAQNG